MKRRKAAQRKDGHQKAKNEIAPQQNPLDKPIYNPSKQQAIEAAQKQTANERAQAASANGNGHAKSANGAPKGLAQQAGAVTRLRAPVARKQFLEAYRKMPFIYVAAQSAGVAAKTISEWRNKYPEFAAAMEAAKTDAFDTLQAHLYVRGGQGVKKPHWMNTKQGPVKVDDIPEYDTRAAELLLRGHVPHRYGKQALELSGPNGAPLQPLIAPTQVQIVIPDNGRSAQITAQITQPLPNEITKQIAAQSAQNSSAESEDTTGGS